MGVFTVNLFDGIGFLPSKVAFDTFDFGVVNEGIGMVFENPQELGNLAAVNDRDDGGGGFPCEHPVGVHDGGTVLELFGNVLAEGIGIFGDNVEGHGITVIAEQQPNAFFKDIHLNDGKQHASQIPIYEIRAANDDIAHNTDETFNVHMAIFFMKHRGDNVGAAGRKAQANHNACTDAKQKT